MLENKQHTDTRYRKRGISHGFKISGKSSGVFLSMMFSVGFVFLLSGKSSGVVFYNGVLSRLRFLLSGKMMTLQEKIVYLSSPSISEGSKI